MALVPFTRMVPFHEAILAALNGIQNRAFKKIKRASVHSTMVLQCSTGPRPAGRCQAKVLTMLVGTFLLLPVYSSRAKREFSDFTLVFFVYLFMFTRSCGV